MCISIATLSSPNLLQTCRKPIQFTKRRKSNNVAQEKAQLRLDHSFSSTSLNSPPSAQLNLPRRNVPLPAVLLPVKLAELFNFVISSSAHLNNRPLELQQKQRQLRKTFRFFLQKTAAWQSATLTISSSLNEKAHSMNSTEHPTEEKLQSTKLSNRTSLYFVRPQQRQ